MTDEAGIQATACARKFSLKSTLIADSANSTN